MKIEYRAPCNQAELDDSIQCCIRSFGGSKSIEHLFINIVKHDPWFEIDNTRSCFLDEKAVSVVQIFDRPMRIGSCVVRMGGIGSVGTDPAHRRAGYSSEVLRDSAQYMQAAGYDLSILFTGIQSHYARAGWVIYPVYSTQLTLPATLPALPDDVHTQLCEPDRDLPTLMAIYDQFNVTRTGTVVRNEAYWNNQPKWREYDSSLFWVAKRDTAVVAYLKASRWEALEFGYFPGEDRAMKALFTRLCQEAKTAGVDQIGAPSPLVCREMFEAIGCTARRRESNHTMIPITNFASLLTKTLPLLEARLKVSRFSQWAGVIRFCYEADKRTLMAKEGNLAILSDRAADIDLVLSQTQLLKLLFGNMSAEQITFSNNLPLSDDEIALLDVLFPPDELFLWRTDGF